MTSREPRPPLTSSPSLVEPVFWTFSHFSFLFLTFSHVLFCSCLIDPLSPKLFIYKTRLSSLVQNRLLAMKTWQKLCLSLTKKSRGRRFLNKPVCLSRTKLEPLSNMDNLPLPSPPPQRFHPAVALLAEFQRPSGHR